MNSTFPLRPIGEISENHDSQRIPVKASNRTPGPYPYYGAQGIVDYIDEYIFDGLFVLVAEDGENIRSRKENIALTAEGKFWANNHVHILKRGSDLLTKYLYYVLSVADISSYITGSTIPKLSQGNLKSIRIPYPPIAYQEDVASFLATLDDKIELNRRMNQTLEAMARVLFKDWFVDFGPTRAKMEGREPYLARDIWDLFPDRLDDEGNPAGWKTIPLSAAFDLLMGQSPPGHTYNDNGDGLPFFQGRTDFGFRFPENRKFCTEPTRIARLGDTLVSVRAPVGDLNVAAEASCIGRGVAALRHKGGSMSFTYYSAWALQEELKQYDTGTGTIFGAINKKQFQELLTVDPGDHFIKTFVDIVGPADERISINEQESRTLARTRDLLLPKLMSGEISVGNAERVANAIT